MSEPTLQHQNGGTDLGAPGTAGNVLTSTGAGWTSSALPGPASIPGPYADDTAAAAAGVVLGGQYYLASGYIVVRLV